MTGARPTGRQRQLARTSLDKLLARLRIESNFSRPPRGWVRAIRDALGMTERQLGERMGVPRQRIRQIEEYEVADGATLRTLRRAAEAMGCTLMYAFVPHGSLEEMVQQEARRIAERRLARVSHTMALENQAAASDEAETQLRSLAEEILRDEPSALWRTS
jgi:predicted DNA-binding mobile mystery protein A